MAEEYEMAFLEYVRTLQNKEAKIKGLREAARRLRETRPELAEACEKEAEEIRQAYCEEQYARAEEYRSRKEYPDALLIYRELGEYRDCPKKIELCRNSHKRKKISAPGIVALVILCMILLCAVGVCTNFGKYVLANGFMALHQYERAANYYEEAGSFAQAQDHYIEAKYQLGISCEEANPKKARQAFADAGAYADSEQRLAAVERRVVGMTEVGEKCTVGGEKWLVLEKSEDAALLLRDSGVDGVAYHQEQCAVTWADCDLREYLNGAFLQENFSAYERENILRTQVKNDGEADTEDAVYLLSCEEFLQYSEMLEDYQRNSWLRSSGSAGDEAAFSAADCKVMESGYAVSSDALTCHPVMWYRIEK